LQKPAGTFGRFLLALPIDTWQTGNRTRTNPLSRQGKIKQSAFGSVTKSKIYRQIYLIININTY